MIIAGNIAVITAYHCMYLEYKAIAQHRLALRNMSAHKKGFMYSIQLLQANVKSKLALWQVFVWPVWFSPLLSHPTNSSYLCSLICHWWRAHGGAVSWGTALWAGRLWWRSRLRHCATSQKVLVGVIGIFHGHNPSGCSVALGSTQPLTEMSKGKAVPLQAWSGPEGSRKLKFPDFMTMAQDGGTHWPPLPPGNIPGTHFCWRLSRPQGHSAIGRILCQWKIHWHKLGSNQRPSDL